MIRYYLYSNFHLEFYYEYGWFETVSEAEDFLEYLKDFRNTNNITIAEKAVTNEIT